MYHIGDKVVYPMHGAGVISAIEEKEILGEKRQYYVMKMPIGDMKVMIPMDNMVEIGIRTIVDSSIAEEVITILKEAEVDLNSNWNKRYRENMMKIKSGDIREVARVVKALMHRDHEKGLSTGERKMLSNAKQILISELVLVKGIDQQEVERIIEGITEES